MSFLNCEEMLKNAANRTNLSDEEVLKLAGEAIDQMRKLK